MSARPFFETVWHKSDQPDILRDRALRRAARKGAWKDWAKAGCTALLAAPWITANYALIQRRAEKRPYRELVGVGVSPGEGIEELVADLGVRHLLIRLPAWDLDPALRFLERFPGHTVLPVLLQDRAQVCDPRLWRETCRRVIAELPDRITHLQIGNAVNRLKWGCATIGEYLDLLQIAHQESRARPGLKLVGSAVIDFEPLATVRSLLNLRGIPLDAAAALLYVDRRGAPQNPQYGCFDLAKKIRTLAAIVQSAPHCGNRLWITETNWPLSGSGDWAPTSEAECVSEADAATYLTDYCRIARDTRLVERVYLWQLVAPGYGLVDKRRGLRKRPAYHAIRALIAAQERSKDAEARGH